MAKAPKTEAVPEQAEAKVKGRLSLMTSLSRQTGRLEGVLPTPWRWF